MFTQTLDAVLNSFPDENPGESGATGNTDDGGDGRESTGEGENNQQNDAQNVNGQQNGQQSDIETGPDS